MADLVIHVGSRSAQGRRPNNEDRFVVDEVNHVFMVADGMGGQESGEKASGLAAEIIPRVVCDRLAAHEDTAQAVQRAMMTANDAIVQAGQHQPQNRRMGTTAVVAVQQAGRVYVASLGDSRAYLIRDDKVELLTVDHTVAQAMVLNGVMSPIEAANSPWRNVLHKFLGCAGMTDGADILPFVPRVGDRLLLASDGLTNHITYSDLAVGPRHYVSPQMWANHLVDLALERGSADNVTCVVVDFALR